MPVCMVLIILFVPLDTEIHTVHMFVFAFSVSCWTILLLLLGFLGYCSFLFLYIFQIVGICVFEHQIAFL